MELDATRLGKARKLVDNIRTRLDVAERVLNAEAHAFNEIELHEPDTENIVNDIVQDRKGYIWIATNNGLNKYDGMDITAFTRDPENSNSLSGNFVW